MEQLGITMGDTGRGAKRRFCVRLARGLEQAELMEGVPDVQPGEPVHPVPSLRIACNIEIQPRGSQTLPPRGMLPLGQTTTPYQIYDAFLDVTRNASGWDTASVKESLNVLSETVDQTSPHLSAALDGVA